MINSKRFPLNPFIPALVSGLTKSLRPLAAPLICIACLISAGFNDVRADAVHSMHHVITSTVHHRAKYHRRHQHRPVSLRGPKVRGGAHFINTDAKPVSRPH